MIRSRTYSLITYNPPSDFEPLLNKARRWAYIYHDKDESEPHYHIYARFDNALTRDGVLRLVKGSQNTFAEILKTTEKDILSYFLHENKDKFQYNKTSIVFSDNFEKPEPDSDSECLIDDILSGMSLRSLASKYGRDFMKNFRSYYSFATLVYEQEHNGELPPYDTYIHSFIQKFEV